MNIAIFTLANSIFTVVLVIGMAWLVVRIRKDLAERPRIGQRDGSQGESGELLMKEIGKALVKTNEQIASFDIVFSDMQAQLTRLQNDVATMLSSSAPTNPLASPLAGLAKPSQDREFIPRVLDPEQAQHTPIPVPIAPLQSEAGSPRDVNAFLEDYRRLVAEPRKNEINRWADDNGGISCQVIEDSTIGQLSRDSGGLLVLFELSGDAAMIVPGGRMVVDFATNFANMISMRSVTRDCFELLGDGSGVLRLLEPARVTRAGDRWTLLAPGSLTGFGLE